MFSLQTFFFFASSSDAGFDSSKRSHFFLVAGSEVSIADLNYVKTDIEIAGPIILLLSEYIYAYNPMLRATFVLKYAFT